MKNLTLLVLTLAFLLLSKKNGAQVSSYSFSQSISSYGAASSGTLIGNNIQDDDVTQVTLPFNFTFDGNSYSTINVCTNGFLSFSSINGWEYSALSDVSTTNIIAPFAQDLFMGTVLMGEVTVGSNTITNVTGASNVQVGDILNDLTGDFGVNPVVTAVIGNTIVVNSNALNSSTNYIVMVPNGSIKQLVTGTAPNRICEFEFRNMTRFAVFNEIIQFKVRLFETSNNIEFLYGFMQPDQMNVPAEVGLKGSANSDYNSRMVGTSNTWSTSISSTSIFDVCDFSSTHFPNNGLSYLWIPPSCTVPVISVTQSSSSVCAGETVTLTATGAVSYSWSNGATTAQISDSPSVTTTYSLLAFDGSCSSSLSVTQFVLPLPAPLVLQSHTTVCPGQSSSLSINGASSYTWSNGSNASQIIVTPQSTSEYTVLASDGTCTNSLTLKVYVVQTPTLVITKPRPFICRNETTTLTVSGASSYIWSTGAVSSSIAISPLQNTTYTVSGIDSGCVVTKTIVQMVSNCTGIEETNSGKLSLKAYPNPFNEELIIEAVNNEKVTVTIMDALGKNIHQDVMTGGSSHSINTSGLNAGIYIISISNTHETVSKKFIKH